ncbi:ATP-grasp domain-containing protein [Zavarzinia sp. CC-PAN008]|uniref:ATP-grasp domain-containing protein n=1 Tax=Zavarzinia sp. CC-PAN008 TaxID=3243332 RepID=UPI003F74551E
MLLIEADAKQMLEDAGLPVPGERSLYAPGDAVRTPGGPVAVKAQVLAGGRGKAGLVRLVDAAGTADAVAAVQALLAAQGTTALVMAERQIDIAQEYYLAWRIDDLEARPVLMFSPHGGVEIEAHGESLRECPVDPLRPVRPQDLIPFFREAGVGGRTLGAIARFAADAFRLMQAVDADLVEINPLAVTPKGDLVALDAKVSLDDNADVRHHERARLVSDTLQRAGMTPLELRAAGQGFTFVELDGDVALFTGGAGLGMALVDMLADAGYRAADFVDAPGGSGTAIFGALSSLIFARAERDDVKAIILFLTLSATSLKGAVESILDLLKVQAPPKPLIVGLVATGAAEREMTRSQAQAAFEAQGHLCVTELDDAIAALRRIAPPDGVLRA